MCGTLVFLRNGLVLTPYGFLLRAQFKVKKKPNFGPGAAEDF